MFLDLFNLSTFLIPRQYIPPLTRNMKRTLSTVSNPALQETEEDDISDQFSKQSLGTSPNTQMFSGSSPRTKPVFFEI